MGNNFVDRSHVEHLLCAVFTAQEENLACKLLADLAGEICRAEAAIEAGDVGVGLLELRMLCTRKREIAHNMETVTAASSPPRNNTDHDFWHEANQSLYLKDVESTASRRVNRVGSFAVGVFVAVLAPNTLIAAGAEGPTTVSW